MSHTIAVATLIRQAIQTNQDSQIVQTMHLLTEQEQEQFIAQLIQEGDLHASLTHSLHFLAATCLDAISSSLSATQSSFRHQVEIRLNALLPPPTPLERKHVAACGALAVPYLRQALLTNA